jgi:hypothetical protein
VGGGRKMDNGVEALVGFVGTVAMRLNSMSTERAAAQVLQRPLRVS